MSEKEPIRGKHDNAHHVGRASNVRATEESQQQLDEAHLWFIEQFGIPVEWAIQASSMDNEIGYHWKQVLEGINDVKSDVVPQ